MRKTSLQIKTAMTSPLSILAARVRDHIDLCVRDFAPDCNQHSPGWAEHADAEFNGLALMLFTLQFEHNTAYRRICMARGIQPSDVTHWSRVPAAPTAAFKELELTCLHPEQRTHVFHSSGTTGHSPSRHFHNTESLLVYESSLWSWFRQQIGDDVSRSRLLCLTPSPAQAPRSSLVHMFDVVRQRLGAPESAFLGRTAADGAWTLDFEDVMQAFEDGPKNGRGTPELILGTAFSFVHLLDQLAENSRRLELPPGSFVMETGGYKGRSRALPKAELHALITERLGVPRSRILCEYGMSELSSQAYDSGARGGEGSFHAPPVARHFHFPPWARALVVSPETGREVADGETGLLRVLDLANVFSVMAIQTEDLAIRRGNGFELIGRATSAESRGCSLMPAGSTS